MLKSAFSGYNTVSARVYLHSFSHCWLSKLRNSERIRTYSRSRSSKVIDLGVSQKRIAYATSY